MAFERVRTRIAPSPTGDPHVGTGYIALYNWAFAKKMGGDFLLRIEDTDQSRSSKQSEQAIFDSLRWLGFDWAEGPDVGGPKGPYRQSERLSIYAEHINALVEKGAAYKCTCTSERLAELRKRQMSLKQPTGYDGHCRNRAEEVEEEIANGAAHVVRLKTPKDGETRFIDGIRGEVVWKNEEIDDQVLLKSDGFPTYHLANIVDDHLMEISHVIRGEEWISSTPKHVLLYDAFGWEKPAFFHLPLLRNTDKTKVSKRKNPVSLGYFQEAGYLPEAMVNFFGLMAFSFKDEREMFSLEDFAGELELERISLGGPVFDLKKLLWLNGRYLREQKSAEDVVQYLQTQLFDTAYLSKIVPLIQDRVEKSEDFFPYADFFFANDINLDPAWLQIADKTKKESTAVFESIAEMLDTVKPFDPESIGAGLKKVVHDNELKPKHVFMPVRLIITGKKGSPPLFDTMAVLGRERCRYRMRRAIAAFKKMKI